MINADALEAALVAWMAEHDKREIFERAQAEHVPCFPVYSPAEVTRDPHYLARRFFVEHDHRVAGEVKLPGAPYLLSGTPWRLRRGAPRLGEHNRDVFGADFESRSERATAARSAQDREAQGAVRVRATTTLPALRTARERQRWRRRRRRHRLPFAGVRIADFGWIFAIPHATSWFAALGADVIRVESMLAPDIVRFLSGTDGVPGLNRSGMFNSINFSRRSITLNLAHPEGAEAARRLVAASDIVTENFTVGTMEKFGLDYGRLGRLKPDAHHVVRDAAGADRAVRACGRIWTNDPGLRGDLPSHRLSGWAAERDRRHLAGLCGRRSERVCADVRAAPSPAHRCGAVYRPVDGGAGELDAARGIHGFLFERTRRPAAG